MPDLSELLLNECWVDVEVPGGTFQVAYRPGTTSLRQQARLMKRIREIQSQTDLDEEETAQEIAIVLCQVVTAWDLTQGGDPLPVTVEVVANTIPGSWVNPIMQAIGNSRDKDQEEKKVSNATSGSGLPQEGRSAVVQNGIHPSEPRGTWA